MRGGSKLSELGVLTATSHGWVLQEFNNLRGRVIGKASSTYAAPLEMNRSFPKRHVIFQILEYQQYIYIYIIHLIRAVSIMNVSHFASTTARLMALL